MRRKDREVTENQEILQILRRSNTIRIGMFGAEYPYVVPVSFGMEVVAEKPILYFHCAKQGMKTELLSQNPNVCVEADTFFKTQQTAHGITTRYESVIGFGKCEEVTDPQEIEKGLKLLLQHYASEDYPLDRCKGIANMRMFKIRVEKMSGKSNPVE